MVAVALMPLPGLDLVMMRESTMFSQKTKGEETPLDPKNHPDFKNNFDLLAKYKHEALLKGQPEANP